jgi:hypothetical protein
VCGEVGVWCPAGAHAHRCGCLSLQGRGGGFAFLKASSCCCSFSLSFLPTLLSVGMQSEGPRIGLDSTDRIRLGLHRGGAMDNVVCSVGPPPGVSHRRDFFSLVSSECHVNVLVLFWGWKRCLFSFLGRNTTVACSLLSRAGIAKFSLATRYLLCL